MSRTRRLMRIRPTWRNPDPPAGGPLRRVWATVHWPLLSFGREFRVAWLMSRGVAPARRWRPPARRILTVSVVVALALFLVFWIVRAVVAVLSDGRIYPTWPWRVDPDSGCHDTPFSCGVVNSSVVPVLTLALSTVLFLIWRLRSIRRYYVREARRSPRALVETAGSIMGEVVGRDQLCIALMDNLKDGTARRPHVVVGAIGTGKTALVVRLTEMLARKGAFPVPVRLRDAQRDLDFADLAYKRFRRVLDPRIRSEAEAEKVWRVLRQEDRIVVLADGLEEALSDRRSRDNRDNVIRQAIRAAGETGLPLVITSRPHDPLRAMEAAITELEPLSEEAALEYISTDGDRRADRRRLDRIIDIANVAESPLYLQIAKDLYGKGLLGKVWVSDEDSIGDGGDHTMWGLKYDLLDTWVASLIDGSLHAELPIDTKERKVTLEYLSALACIGLKLDSAQVELAELERYPEIRDEVRRKRKGVAIDLRLAATWGTRMGIVEEAGVHIRFQHSLLQAFLGSRYLGVVLRDLPEPGAAPARPSAYFPSALHDPSREILIALVFRAHSLTEDSKCSCARRNAPRGGCPNKALRDLLVCEARRALPTPEPDPGAVATTPPDVARSPARDKGDRARAAKVLDMYGAALDIDSVESRPDPGAVVAPLVANWGSLQERDPQRLRAAKLALVRRLGAASRRAVLNGGMPAYRELFDLAVEEPAYRVRIAIAQEIGGGGAPAYLALRDTLREAVPTVIAEPEPSDPATTSGPASSPASGPVSAPASEQPPTAGRSIADLSAELRRAGTAGLDLERDRRKQGNRLREKLDRQGRLLEEAEAKEEKKSANRNTMSARLLPLLVDSVAMAHHAGTPYEDLDAWLSWFAAAPGNGHAHGHGHAHVHGHVRHDRPANGHAEGPDPFGTRVLEVAMAHGFKHAANRRANSQIRKEAREFLAEQAWEMLKANRFWFTRLTLLHALTLWALPEDTTQERPEHGHGAAPADQVRRWLQLPDGEQDHPFVLAAERLAVRALETRHPERFLWIDEATVAAHVGSEAGPHRALRQDTYWIAPSAGWSTLDPAAQQLLADVILLISLTERADRPRELFRRMEWDRDIPAALPPCLTHDRTTIDPTRTGAPAVSTPPGSLCADACDFKLCPYPLKIPDLRVELSEVFCMHQHSLLRTWQWRAWLQLRVRRRARWQRHTPIAGLRQFWHAMGARARDTTGPPPTPRSFTHPRH
ncbi:NACHT domain-containing protein [Kitasatospora sp. NPDC093806]|uniref:NACHT domain-containing protein n=1 Tax=Kitasatospora sp. NPDC093806 TaxID=3155075 RepID=UPI00344651C2